jgi:hypothetical protein
MAVSAKDGSRHHSASRAKMHDEMAASSKGGNAGTKPAKEPAKEAAGGTSIGNMKVEELVGQHGPAHHVEHMHDGESVKTTTHHGTAGADGGFTHEATHDNVHSADLHAHFASGKKHPAPTEHSIEDHVAEHGPAHHVVHMHDEESGEHHVTSHHGPDHAAHHSVHKSHEAAHEHMGQAMGIGGEENDDETKDRHETESAEDEAMEGAHQEGAGAIPGLG